MTYRDLNESPIQRLQREVREQRELFRQMLEVQAKCIAGVDALNDLDTVRAENNRERFEEIERRCDAIMLLIRAMNTPEAEVADAMLRSVDDDA